MIKYFNQINKLMKKCHKEVDEYNSRSLIKTLFIIGCVSIFPILMSAIRPSMLKNIPVYASLCIGCIVLFLVFKFTPLKKYPAFGLYLAMILAFSISMYLSFVSFSYRPSATFLIVMCVAPLLIIDEIWRIDLFMLIVFIIHGWLSYQIKGTVLGGSDIINSFVSLFLGLSFGTSVIHDRLQYFDSRSKLIKDNIIDVLTQTNNRRKLYQDFAKMENNIMEM